MAIDVPLQGSSRIWRLGSTVDPDDVTICIVHLVASQWRVSTRQNYDNHSQKELSRIRISNHTWQFQVHMGTTLDLFDCVKNSRKSGEKGFWLEKQFREGPGNWLLPLAPRHHQLWNEITWKSASFCFRSNHSVVVQGRVACVWNISTSPPTAHMCSWDSYAKICSYLPC